MVAIARGRGNGALFDLTGVVSNNSTWDEYIYFARSDEGLDLTDLSFQLQFRACPNGTSAALTLSTASGQLVITNDTDGNPTILRINVPYTTIQGLQGDYFADLASKDDDDKIVHWASGIVTFSQSPIAF
jgi:hypothetical protein